MAAVPPQSAQPVPAVPAINATGNSRVVLRAHAPTRITVKGADGTTYANRDIGPGESFEVPSVPGLSLAIADAGAVNVMLDGRDLGSVGESRQVLGRVSLDPSSLVDRFGSR
jgi:cytoskeleton protein RodZ